MKEQRVLPFKSLSVRVFVATLGSFFFSTLTASLGSIVDGFVIGHTMGTASAGACSLVHPLAFLFAMISGVLCSGFQQHCTSYLAKGETEKARKLFSLVLIVGIGISAAVMAVVAIISAFVLKPLVMLLGSTETISPYAQTYISYILAAAPFITASFTMNNLLRYEGKATLGMIGLIVGAVLNIAGDPILMFGLNMGIAGAGLSTCISQIVGFFVLLSMFLLHKTQCRLSVKLIAPKFLPEIIGTGLPSLLRQGLNSLSTVVLNNCAAVYGDAAVAAMSIVSRVIFFTFSFALGVGQGFQPVCGFNYGAKKYDRLKTAFYFSVMLAEIIVVVMSVGLILFPGEIVRIFRDDNTVMEIGSRALVLQGIAQLFLPFCMITEMALQSVGKKLGASVLSTLRNGLFFIPLLLILSNVRGLSGIQEAQPLAVTLAVIPSAILAVRFFRELPKNTEQSRGEAENEQ